VAIADRFVVNPFGDVENDLLQMRDVPVLKFGDRFALELDFVP
jgi:hypothetical protein